MIAHRKALELELTDQTVAALLVITGGSVDANIEGLVGLLYMELYEFYSTPLGKGLLVHKCPVSGYFDLVLGDILHTKCYKVVCQTSFGK